MCLLAKIDNKEYWAFYMEGIDSVELRDEHFHAQPLPRVKSVMVKDELDPSSSWSEMPPSTLVRLAKARMDEAMVGLKNISRG